MRRKVLDKKKFQFTPLREGRLEPGEEEAVPAQFQFTPLREGRLPEFYGEKADVPFQFTPLREGRRSVWRERHRRT